MPPQSETEQWYGEYATDDRWVFARVDGVEVSLLCSVAIEGSELKLACEPAEGRILAGDRGRFWVYDPDLRFIDFRGGTPTEAARARVPWEFWISRDMLKDRFVPAIDDFHSHGFARIGKDVARPIRFQVFRDWFTNRAEEFQVDGDHLFITAGLSFDGWYRQSTVVFHAPPQ